MKLQFKERIFLTKYVNGKDVIISNDCKNLQGITAEHLDELTIVNIALLTLLMWSI